ncbi:MAG: M14 family metallopeptidase [Abditibacteriales bacterium]|nr:M14 family metallopeptidase [Abditibacteriales bacterium]MDW8366737.1 M14 family metallopeptidase [Abditibacteriales bacterium]
MPNVPTLEDVLGYTVGERITHYAGLEKYLHALAEVSDRVRLESYGKTYEGRALYNALISAPTNLEKSDDIRENIRLLADPRLSPNVDEIVQNTPAVIYVGANIHGGETSTGEAALLLAYRLASGEDDITRQILENCVIVLDACQNPDGRDRFVNYYYSVFSGTPNPDPNAIEHHMPFPASRGNHYYYDLNRDWIWLTQIETVQKVKAYLSWRPQVVIDLHEMGSDATFYFPPPAPPVNLNTGATIEKWWAIFGRAMSEAFDREGFDYYVKESFDSYYPGYTESWVTFHGAVGMTFEQASVRGIVIKRRDEALLTFREAIEHHVVAMMATLTTAAQRKEELLRDFHTFHATAIEEGRTGRVKEFLIAPSDKAQRLAHLLTAQGIEVRQAAEEFTTTAHNYLTDEATEVTLPAGTYVVRMDQPAKRLIQTLLEREPQLPEDFLKEELERKAQRIPDRFYDTTAWALPLAFGVEMYWTENMHEDGGLMVQGADSHPQPATPNPRYAYLLPPTSDAWARTLARLAQDGYRVHVAQKAFTVNGRKFERGTLVIKVRGNKEDLRERLSGVPHLFGVDGAWTEDGVSLGSNHVSYVTPPKIAVLYDVPAFSLSYGWLAYLLEQRYQVTFTPVRESVLRDADLKDYNVIVLPSGSPQVYARFFGEAEAKRLKDWVHNGGTLITFKGATVWAARKEIALTTCRHVNDLRKLKVEDADERDDEDGKKKKKDEFIPHEHRPDHVPGAVLRVKLDTYHFLTFGCGETANVMVDSDHLFTPSREGWNVATFVEEERLRVSGFVWEKMLKALPGNVFLADERMGRGHVILFTEDPHFRCCWEPTQRMLMNALLLSPSLAR